MTKAQAKTVLDRFPTWPRERQQQVAKLAIELATEFAAGVYQATPDELQAIDEGLGDEAASEEDVKAAFASFRRT